MLDDTGLDNSELCQEIVDMDPQRIEYIQNETNIGLCASVNRGFKLAIERQANWVLVMNPDGTFQNNAIDIYKKYIYNNDVSHVAIIAPVFNLDRKEKMCFIRYEGSGFS